MTEPSKEAIELFEKAYRALRYVGNDAAALVIQEALAERDARIAELAGLHDEGWAQAKLKDDRIIALEAEIEKLREALLDALSHCYNCSGDPHYIEEDEVTGDHLWTDCPICRSARAALGETK